MFFRTYTEKVWGLKCKDIRPEWAAQRIKTLTLGGALRKALMPGGRQHRSLIEEFNYPEKGPGMLWERMACLVREAGGEVVLEQPVVSVRRTGFRVDSVGDPPRRHERSGAGTISSRACRSGAGPAPSTRRLRRDPGGRAGAEVSRLHHGGPDRRRRTRVPRQLDLHPHSGASRWPHPELQELEPGHGARPEQTCLGMEYFCNRGGRPVVAAATKS